MQLRSLHRNEKVKRIQSQQERKKKDTSNDFFDQITLRSFFHKTFREYNLTFAV